MHTDTKFFTNTDNDSLLERFRTTLIYTRYFDVLVGYFRASGFSALAESLENVEKIRILVGLNADSPIVQASYTEGSLPFFSISHEAVQKNYALAVQEEMENAPERQETEDSIALFIRYIHEGKIEIKGHPSRDIHAKVYIIRYKDGPMYGSVITGSSNFSFSGLTAQREFNVELKDKPDVDFALNRFELLWSEGATLTEAFVATVTQKTWLNDAIQPYELYLKFLYEYFKEDINIDDSPPSLLPDGFINLEYQRQAVIAAGKILSAHGGVFLADVVGLGKTVISAMLLQQLQGYKLIICPPVLKRYWEESLIQFHVAQYKVCSAGKVEDLAVSTYSRYKYVLIDESHRFRNENTQGYEQLKKICLGKKIILVSATPLNNRLGDILAQIKLFQPGRRSTIPGVPDLEAFFRQRDKELRELTSGTPEYKEASERAAALVRDKVLKHIMIRRTRGEVSRYFSADIINQGLRFPTLAPPVALTYQFDSAIEDAFQTTISLLQSVTYARYTPLLYLKRGATEQEKISQGNARGFIKSILVKRLESSFYAFGRTIERFISSYQAFLQAYDLGSVFIGKSVDIGELLDIDDAGILDEILSRKGVEQYPAKDFIDSLHADLVYDLTILQQIAAIWKSISDDPKFEAFLASIITDPRLQNERLIVFTESQETAQYLHSRLESDMPSISMRFSSKGGVYGKQTLSGSFARDFIQANFDPSHSEPKNEFRILITTDVLAEGMNLHRAGRIMNYDLPWNPTRVMQRVGRINRVGTEHHDIYLFNFFPTAQSDAHLGLEANIIKKIDAFNVVLGNDSQYLYEAETPDPHGLFGERLVKRLSSLADEENEEDSELKYLQIIRQVRDDTPDIFERIKRLPVKARSAHYESQKPDNLLVFFREGALKKFVLTGQEAHELTFLEAAPLMSCTPNAVRVPLPKDYYERLKTARGYFEQSLEMEVLSNGTTLTTKTRKLLEIIRALQHHKAMTDDDQEYLQRLYGVIVQSAIAKKTITTLQNICNRQHIGPVGLLNAMRKSMPASILVETVEELTASSTIREPKQIILTQYLAPKGN
ncbi:MAG: helicase-related protein [Desulfovibrionaceae bacterium]